MPLTADTQVNVALDQYRSNTDFRAYVLRKISKLDGMIGDACLDNATVKEFLALPAGNGQPMAKVLMDQFQAAIDGTLY